MRKAEIIGNAQIGRITRCRQRVNCCREKRHLGIGRCQENNLASRLTEIDRLVGGIERSALVDFNKMHVLQLPCRQVGQQWHPHQGRQGR